MLINSSAKGLFRKYIYHDNQIRIALKIRMAKIINHTQLIKHLTELVR